MIWLDEPFATLWKNKDVFHEIQQIEGDIYRHKEGRKTLRFEVNGEGYFLKWHAGVGWKEIVKNLVQLRLPILGAKDEFDAICKMALIGVDSMRAVGFGIKGLNPANQKSFLITKELTDVISLEDYCAKWKDNPPSEKDKKNLIKRVALIAKKIHENGINHRDFYLCHFLMDKNGVKDIENSKIYLIDLHRAQIRSRVPKRWLIKDLGALFYSALNIGLSKEDVNYFIREYGLTINNRSKIMQKIKKRAESIYIRDYGISPEWPS